MTYPLRQCGPSAPQTDLEENLLPSCPRLTFATSAAGRGNLLDRVASCDSFHVFDMFAGFVVRAELLRHRLQRGIELYEGVLDRGVLFVAGPAFVALRHGLGCFVIWFKAEVGPFVGISGGVFAFDG